MTERNAASRAGRPRTAGEVEATLARARRFRGRVDDRAGPGTSWEFTFPDGVTQRMTIEGIRPFDDLHDDVASAFQWVWSLKDHFKRLARDRRSDPNLVEQVIASVPAFKYVQGVVNTAKHGLPRPGSGELGLQLGAIEFAISANSLRGVTIGPASVTLEPSDPAALELLFPVVDVVSGEQVGDAIEILDAALTAWEWLLAKLYVASAPVNASGGS